MHKHTQILRRNDESWKVLKKEKKSLVLHFITFLQKMLNWRNSQSTLYFIWSIKQEKNPEKGFSLIQGRKIAVRLSIFCASTTAVMNCPTLGNKNISKWEGGQWNRTWWGSFYARLHNAHLFSLAILFLTISLVWALKFNLKIIVVFSKSNYKLYKCYFPYDSWWFFLFFFGEFHGKRNIVTVLVNVSTAKHDLEFKSIEHYFQC